jgi:DNA-binding response OmpR family regulator
MEKKRTLLIADDDRQIHKLFSGYFSADFELLHAYDGADALMLAAERHPDIVLLDVKMPILDGRTVCRKIRDNPRMKDVRIVMITGKGGEYDRLVGLEVGADEYVEKPVSLEGLTRTFERLLG